MRYSIGDWPESIAHDAAQKAESEALNEVMTQARNPWAIIMPWRVLFAARRYVRARAQAELAFLAFEVRWQAECVGGAA